MSNYTAGYDYEPASQGGPYLNLKSKGDKARVRIASYPIMWDDEYQGKLTKRFAWAVVHKTQGPDGIVKEAKAFRAGSMIYKAVRALLNDEDWGDPRNYDLEIERTEDKNSFYTVTPKPNGKPLTDEEKALFADHGFSEKPDWANPWLEKLFLSKKDGSSAPAHDEYDPFADE